MHIISIKALKDFWIKHNTAKAAMMNWHAVCEASKFRDLNDVKDKFNSADYVSPYTIFNVGGNNYTIITSIHYNTNKVYIRHVFTHKEYDIWNKLYQKRKQ